MTCGDGAANTCARARIVACMHACRAADLLRAAGDGVCDIVSRAGAVAAVCSTIVSGRGAAAGGLSLGLARLGVGCRELWAMGRACLAELGLSGVSVTGLDGPAVF